MKLRQSLAWQFGIFLGTVALSVAMAPTLPARVPTHWGIEGKPDAWGSPTFALWIGPILSLSMLILTVAIPWFPGGKNVGRFGDTYSKMMMIVNAYMGFMHFGILRATAGGGDFPTFLIAGMFFFFAMMGNLMGKVKPNPYMGIRTPWTMRNEKVWEVSHRRGAWIYVGGGLIGGLAVLAGAPMPVAFVMLMVVALYPILDSYLVSRRIEGRGA